MPASMHCSFQKTGVKTSLIWFPRIFEMERYLRYLRRVVANVLDGFSLLFPGKMLRKMKLHLLVRLEEDVVRFGPLVGASSERFESFNAVFRQSVIHSNRKRQSRDIASDCAGQERVKTIMSGGYVRDGQTWRLPSGRLLALMEGIGFLKQQYALWHPKEDPGKVVLYPRRSSAFMTGNDLTLRISNSGQFRHILQSLHLAQPCWSVSSREDTFGLIFDVFVLYIFEELRLEIFYMLVKLPSKFLDVEGMISQVDDYEIT